MRQKVFVIVLVILLLASIVLFATHNIPEETTIVPTVTLTPTSIMQNPNWKTFTDTKQHVSFQYPENFSTTYISVIDWPPKIQMLETSFTCTEAGDEASRAGKTEKRIINGSSYCVTTITEGAAGSIYNQYAYAFASDDKTAILTFSLKFVQCGNYEDPQKTQCEHERQTFNMDTLIDSVAQSVKLQS